MNLEIYSSNHKGILQSAEVERENETIHFNQNRFARFATFPFEHKISLHYSCGLVETYQCLTNKFLPEVIDWRGLNTLRGGLEANDLKRFKLKGGFIFRLGSCHYSMDDITCAYDKEEEE